MTTQEQNTMETKRLQRHMPAMIAELKALASKASMYNSYACNYIDELSDVNYMVFKKAWRKADTKGNLSQAAFCRGLVK